MGMDIYGKKYREEERRRSDHAFRWDAGEPDMRMEEQKDRDLSDYFKWKRSQPGIYFRASIFSWPSILGLIEVVNEHEQIGISPKLLISMGANNGTGLESQEHCTALADALQRMLDRFPDVDTIEVPGSLPKGCAWIADAANALVGPDSPLRQGANTVMIDGKRQVSCVDVADATEYIETDRAHLIQFVAFLRDCGGFEIW